MTTDVYVGGLPFSHTGVLQITARPSTGVPATADYNAGFAVDSASNAVFALDAGTAVPATATFVGGIAKTPDGAIYTTMVDSVGTFFNVSGGVRVRSDGALLICAEEPASDARMTYLGTTGTNQGVCVGPVESVLEVLLSDGSTVANYQPGVGVTGTLTASAWANQIGAAGSLEQATGANQPIYLSFTGSKYYYSPAIGSNYLSTPNKAAFATVTTTLEVQYIGTLNDWTAGATQDLVAKNWAGFHFRLSLTNQNKPQLHWSTNNAGYDGNSVSSTAVTFTDGSLHGLKATLTLATGAVVFETSEDEGATWSAYSTTAGAGATTVTAANTDPLEILSEQKGAATYAGRAYRAKVIIDGVTVADFNAADWSETSTNGATQVSSTTGETWTLNNTAIATCAAIVGSSFIVTNESDRWMRVAYTADQPRTLYIVGMDPVWAAGKYIADGVTANTLGLSKTTGTPKLSLNAGAAAAENAGFTLRAKHVLTIVLNVASSSTAIDSVAAVTGNPGAGNPGGLTIGADGGTPTAGSFGGFWYSEIIDRDGADSAGTQAKIQALLKALHGTP